MPVPETPIAVLPLPLDLAWQDTAANLAQIAAALQAIPSDPRTLVVFPELTLTGFVTADPQAVALTPDSPALTQLCQVVKQAGVAAVVGWPERGPDGSVSNTSALIDHTGQIRGRYRKMHLFPIGNPAEATTYTRGTQGLVLPWQGWRLGFATCFDLRFPALFGAYAAAGVDLVVAPACWVAGPWKSLQFRTLASAHAMNTQAYVVAVNRSGSDPAFRYAGDALVASPMGSVEESAVPLVLQPELLAVSRRMVLRSADHPSYRVTQLDA